jgi:hypothetical protein
MQITLRIDDEIYREAQAEAAREGITLTKFIEEALCFRLGRVDSDSAQKNQVSDACSDASLSALIKRLELLFEQADERDRLKDGSAGPFSCQEL